MRDQELRGMSLADLHSLARKLGVIGASLMSKEQLITHIIDLERNPEKEIEVEGVL